MADKFAEIALYAKLSGDRKHALHAERLSHRYRESRFCIRCGERLFGKQLKFCSDYCKHYYWSRSPYRLRRAN